MRTGNWTAQYTINAASAAVATFTNMPAADAFLFSSTRHIVLADLSGMTYVRLKVNKQTTAATSGAKLTLRYSPTFSTVVSDYIDIGITEVSVGVDVVNQYLTSSWVEIDSTALCYEDVYLAVVGSGGNGTLDPTFGNISVSFC
ncbi:MAG: hypothetical protein ABIR37_01140 [Candidatus Saccharimonadales bacterium]